MTWYTFPALAFIVAFLCVLMPRPRRWSHYIAALACGFIAGSLVTVLTLLVWGITR